MRIDSHHSFTERYPLEHLESILKRNRMDGSILVTDALPPDWPTPDFVRGIVVELDLADENLPHLLDAYQRHPKFRGICHEFAGSLPTGLAELERRAIRLDAKARPAIVAQIAQRFPTLHIVIDHAGQAGHPAQTGESRQPPWGGPPSPSGTPSSRSIPQENPPSTEADQWARDLAQAAQFPQVFCKLSAVAKLVPAPRPCVQHALAVFGPSRLMFGSDWPAGLPDTTWKASLAAFTQAIGAQPIEIREELLGGTAERFYGV